MNRTVRIAAATASLVIATSCDNRKATEKDAALPTEGAGAAAAEIQPANAEQVLEAVRATGAPVTLLNVWATWCAPCREEFPDLMRIRDAYRERGLRMVLVSADWDEQLPAARRFLAQHGVDFVTYVKQDDDMRFIDAMSPRWSGALPATLLYDGSGQLAFFHEGKASFELLDREVQHILESAPSHSPQEVLP